MFRGGGVPGLNLDPDLGPSLLYRIMNVSGEYLAKNGISTFACSETQKFGHVTFFWNGNRSGFFDAKLETYLEVRRRGGGSPERGASVTAAAATPIF